MKVAPNATELRSGLGSYPIKRSKVVEVYRFEEPCTKKKSTLDELAAQANDCHQQCEENWRTALTLAKKAGDALRKARDQLGHGEWMPWVEANFVGSYEKAYQYITISEKWHLIEQHLEDDPLLSINRALKCIRSAKPKPDPVAPTTAEFARMKLKETLVLFVEEVTGFLEELPDEEAVYWAEPTKSSINFLADRLDIMIEVLREMKEAAVARVPREMKESAVS